MTRPSPAAELPRPGPAHGEHPERRGPPGSLPGDLADLLGEHLGGRALALRRERRRFLACLDRAEADPALAAADLRPAAAAAGAALLRQGLRPDAVARAQALAAAAIERATGLRPYRTQHRAAFELVCGRLVEMDTGEGKSLAVLLAAAVAALAGVPVHVVTANDYLAARDAAAAQAVLAPLGLGAGALAAATPGPARRAAYAREVVYASAQELGFDYLRDRGLAPAERLQRGLCWALVDEADSVLLDQAQTPLVLSRRVDDDIPPAAAQAAWIQAGQWREGREFRLDARERRVELLAPASRAPLPAPLGAVREADRRQALLRDALLVRNALTRDVHYLVEHAGVVLLDATTGRRLPGTVWSRGVQRMLHLKEGLPPPPATETSRQITLQALFGRYLRLSGLSGTLREPRWSLWLHYRLEVCRVEPRRASRLRRLGVRLYASRRGQLDAVAARARELAAAGRAVLVGTDSVAAADTLSHALREAGVAHRLLTARDDAREAELVGRAGEPGAVTVATHVAGRGTDIPVAPAVLAAGGLHVLCCAQNGSRRIDRQLFGRAARNGQPGSCEAVLTLEDREYRETLPLFLVTGARLLADSDGRLARWLERTLPWCARTLGATGAALRGWQLVRQERLARDALAFAPSAE